MSLSRGLLMNFTLLVKTLESGQVAASVLELPGYRVEAASKEIAIEQLRTTLIDHLQDVEALPWQLPVELPASAINPWARMFGAFKDDAYFDQVMDIIQADRDALGDDELDPAYYMP
jgi:hypothetical protein